MRHPPIAAANRAFLAYRANLTRHGATRYTATLRAAYVALAGRVARALALAPF